MTNEKHLGEHSSLNSTEISIVVKMAVRDTLEEMGIDLASPEGREAARKDFAYMRRQRVGGEKIADGIRNAGIIAFVSAFAWALWQGIKLALNVSGGGSQ